MINFLKDIEEEANGEEIEFVVIGGFGWSGWDDDSDEKAFGFERRKRTPVPKEKKNVALGWEEGKKYLDYSYDVGFGAPDCHAIVAWTETRAIFVSTYDGSTSVESIPRNPTNFKPQFYGGG